MNYIGSQTFNLLWIPPWPQNPNVFSLFHLIQMEGASYFQSPIFVNLAGSFLALFLNYSFPEARAAKN